MATSLITKKRIAKSFKKLLTEQAFEKISVRQIMEDAGIRKRLTVIMNEKMILHFRMERTGMIFSDEFGYKLLAVGLKIRRKVILVNDVK